MPLSITLQILKGMSGDCRSGLVTVAVGLKSNSRPVGAMASGDGHGFSKPRYTQEPARPDYFADRGLGPERVEG